MDKVDEKPKARPERRKPFRQFGRAEDKSEVLNKHADYHYVWMNDSGNTLALAEESGYEYVLRSDPERVVSGDVTSNTKGGDITNRVCQVVDRSGTLAFLMRIPLEIWSEQQQQRDRDAVAPMRQLDSSKGKPQDVDDNFYVKSFNPTQSIGR